MTGVPRGAARREAAGRLPPLPTALVLAVLGGAQIASGEEGGADAGPDSGPALLLADEVTHDDRSQTTTARGRVELSRGARVLQADSLRYDRERDIVSASGEVSLLEPSGTVMFAEEATFAGDLKSGTARPAGVLFTDRSRLAAAGGRKTVDGRTELRKAVYSPCEPCEEDPAAPPLWRIAASRVLHDPEDKTVTYRDATLDFVGLPVFYTPYLSQPDPTVRRKTGFLTPTPGRNTLFGFTWLQPLYVVLSPYSDATITPIFLSRGTPVLTAQYRHELTAGSLVLEGSVTRDDLQPAGSEFAGETRGHANLAGDFMLGTRWRYGFTVERATDATYLRRYQFGGGSLFEESIVQTEGVGGSRSDDVLGFARGKPYLTENLFLRGRDRRWRVAVDTWRFQSFDPNADEDLSAVVAPVADFDYRSDPGARGDVWNLHANTRLISRRRGAGSVRLSTTGGWRLPLSTGIGDRLSAAASLRLDGYRVTDADVDPGPDPAAGQTETIEEAFAGRALPQAELRWRWPWVRLAGSWNLTIEPLATAILAPDVTELGDADLIRNDDSLAFEFDELNLFEDNRYPGLDRVEGGTRGAWGLRFGAFGTEDARAELLFGQALRLWGNAPFDPDTGLATKASDYVGRLSIHPADWLGLTARFRLDRDRLSVRRGSLSVAAGPSWLRGGVHYVGLSNAGRAAGEPSSVRHVDAWTKVSPARYWELGVGHRRDLAEKGGPLDWRASVAYSDECLTVSVDVSRRFTRQRDVPDATDILFRIKLRNLD